MSAPEIAWRLHAKGRGLIDRSAYRARQKPVRLADVCASRDRLISRDVLGDHLLRIDSSTEFPQAWQQACLSFADSVMDHRLSFFNLNDVDLGTPINWNYEFRAGKATPLTFADDIDYRDFDVTGDCKFAWEPSRHHQWVPLGCAYRLTRDEKYAEALLSQMESWIEQCPFGVGMQWRSPLELGIRLINWVWSLELIRDANALTGDRFERIAGVAYRHLWETARKFSRYSSANNHLIGEAAGVFIGSSYFSGFRASKRWRATSRAILINEIFEQTYPDGGTREQALGYHLFVLQFFLLSGLVARNTGDDLTPEYWQRLEKMFEFAAGMWEGGALPQFGDADDGYVLRFGHQLTSADATLSVGAALFNRADFKSLTNGFTEPAYWLLGDPGRESYEAISTPPESPTLHARAYADTGYYVLQRGSVGREDSVSVVFDCGPLGFKSIAAHGHADALSFTLRVGGLDVLVDSGTYDYFTYEDWRNYFRSTAAHNTVEIDGVSQSEILGSFMWGRRAESRCTNWEPTGAGGKIVAEHDGYDRLPDPVRHRRTLEMDPDGSRIDVLDEIIAENRHRVCLRFHFSEWCQVEQQSNNKLSIDFPGGRMVMAFDERMSLSVVCGRESPAMGWVSRGYHQKSPIPTVEARCEIQGKSGFHTRIEFELRKKRTLTAVDPPSEKICT